MKTQETYKNNDGQILKIQCFTGHDMICECGMDRMKCDCWMKGLISHNQPERLNPEASKEDVIV